jgi:hypothetical protein
MSTDDPLTLGLTGLTEQLIQNQLLDRGGWEFIRLIKKMHLLHQVDGVWPFPLPKSKLRTLPSEDRVRLCGVC